MVRFLTNRAQIGKAVIKMHGTNLEATSMEKFAGLFAGLTLACGLAFAQTDSPSAGATSPATTSPATTSPGTTMVTIQQWRGTLVDASCAGSSNTKTADQASQPAEQGQAVDTGRPHKAHAKSETPAAGCTVSSSTTAFALQTNDGHVMPFDSVGNIRAAETLKSKANWTKDISAGKPIHAKVSGTLTGETITVAALQ
jgi:hypothetical protein